MPIRWRPVPVQASLHQELSWHGKGYRMNRLSHESHMVRDAVVVALRAADTPRSASDLVPFMPWHRRRHDTDCRQYPHAKHFHHDRARMVECHTAWHVYEALPFAGQVYQHLTALERRGVVQRVPATRGKRVCWALTPEGAAADEIDELRRIVDLDSSVLGAFRSHTESAPPSIDWRAVVDQVSRFDAGEFAAGRSHLITADTYRHSTACALGNGAEVGQLELLSVDIVDSRAMALHSERRVAIVVSDLRGPSKRAAAAAEVMDILYRVSRIEANERVLVIIAGLPAISQIEVYVPAALDSSGASSMLPFQQAVSGGMAVAKGSAHLLPDLTITALGRSSGGAPHRVVVAVKVDIHGESIPPRGAL